MSIRAKILAVIVISSAILSVAAYAISQRVLLNSYLAIEGDAMERNVTRANNSIDNSLAELTIKLRDWAQWDDSYAFVEDRNTTFIEVNLQPATLTNLEINLLAYATLDGEIIFKRVVDLASGAEIENERMVEAIASAGKLSTLNEPGTSLRGIVALPEGPFLLTILPVITTEGEGPVKGVIMFGQFLDDRKIASLSDLTQLSIKLFPFNGDALPSDVGTAKDALSNGAGSYIIPLTEDIIAGYSTLYDWEGQPVSIMRVDTSRPIYTQGKQTLTAFMAFSALAVLAFGAVILLLMEKFMMSRLARLSADVSAISISHDLSKHIRERGKDEIGKVALAINGMIDALAESRNEERKLREREHQAGEKLKERVAEIEKMNKMMVDRELRMVELKKELDQTKTDTTENPT